MTGWSITAGRLTPAQTAGVLALAEAAEAADGVAPLSEHVLLHLRYDGTEDRDLVLTVTEDPAGSENSPGEFGGIVGGSAPRVAGYAHLDATSSATGTELSGELAIHPDHRRVGLGLVLVRALTAQADGHPVRLWAHGDLPAAARLARAAGFDRFRALWQMRRSLGDPLDQPRFPPGTALRTFRPGQDEDEWVSLNRRAFAEHPEQGAWTRHDLELREREPWFDPGGFFIAERRGAMAGFHWTKVHGPGDAPAGLGEVYVVGVDPGEQGTGLGRALTLAGLQHLRDRGLAQVMLYVDEDNVPAIRLYESLGFARWRTDAMYRHTRGDTPPRTPRTPGRLADTRGIPPRTPRDPGRLAEARRGSPPKPWQVSVTRRGTAPRILTGGTDPAPPTRRQTARGLAVVVDAQGLV